MDKPEILANQKPRTRTPSFQEQMYKLQEKQKERSDSSLQSPERDKPESHQDYLSQFTIPESEINAMVQKATGSPIHTIEPLTTGQVNKVFVVI